MSDLRTPALPHRRPTQHTLRYRRDAEIRLAIAITVLVGSTSLYGWLCVSWNGMVPSIRHDPGNWDDAFVGISFYMLALGLGCVWPLAHNIRNRHR